MVPQGLEPWSPNYNNWSNNYHTTVNTNGKSGKVIDTNEEPLIGVNVYIQGTDQGTITDFDGQFYLPQAIGKTIVVKYVGYSNLVCRLPQQYAVFTLSEGTVLDEIVVVGKGRRNRTSIKYEEPKRKQIDLKINETLNTLSYVLSKTYSIKSDSEPIDVLLKKESLPTLLQYESIPVKNESAFLIAEIKEWHLYNLEPAPINLFIDGTFKGKSSLNPDSQDNKLKISLGTDPEVSLSRKWINNKYKKKLLSRHKEETHHYTLPVKNNKTKPITIKIKDQIPISSDTAIEIKPENLSGGKLEEESGCQLGIGTRIQ